MKTTTTKKTRYFMDIETIRHPVYALTLPEGENPDLAFEYIEVSENEYRTFWEQEGEDEE